MKKLIIALFFLLAPSAAFAQCTGVFPAQTICGSIPGGPPGPVSTTAFALVPGGTSGQYQVNNGAGGLGGVTFSGDCTATSSGVITCIKSGGVSFGTLAFVNGSIGTSGATIPLNNSNNTFSGIDTFSGTFNCTSTCQLAGIAFGTFATQNFATPPVIGGTTPNSAVFSNITLNNALLIGYGGTGATSAPTARVNLIIDQLARPGDANFAITNVTRTVAHTALSTARTDTLPAASTVNAGQTITVVDAYGVATSSNTITVTHTGSDTINGGTSAVIINSQFGGVTLTSDGISNWSFVPASSGGGSGTVTQVSCAKGTVCSNITSSGTVTAPAAVWALASSLGAL